MFVLFFSINVRRIKINNFVFCFYSSPAVTIFIVFRPFVFHNRRYNSHFHLFLSSFLLFLFSPFSLPFILLLFISILCCSSSLAFGIKKSGFKVKSALGFLCNRHPGVDLNGRRKLHSILHLFLQRTLTRFLTDAF